MRQIVLLVFMVVIVGMVKLAEGEDWYAIKVWENRCAKLSEVASADWKTPADIIKAWQYAQIPYKVIDDKVENWKVVQVTLTDLTDYSCFTLYYGLERCKETLRAKKMKQEKELEKYK